MFRPLWPYSDTPGCIGMRLCAFGCVWKLSEDFSGSFAWMRKHCSYAEKLQIYLIAGRTCLQAKSSRTEGFGALSGDLVSQVHWKPCVQNVCAVTLLLCRFVIKPVGTGQCWVEVLSSTLSCVPAHKGSSFHQLRRGWTNLQ